MNLWRRGSQHQEERQIHDRTRILHPDRELDRSGQADAESSELQKQLKRAQDQWKKLFRPPSGSAHNTPEIKAPRKLARKLTRENQRTNASWGDGLQPKDPLCTRVYVQNVNGISLDRRGGQFNDICMVIKEVQADIFGGQEHNLDTTQMQVRSTLYETAHQHWDRNRMCFGTTPIT